MLERVLLCTAAATALILGPAAARADVAVPGEHRVPSEVVFTGLRDFPAYRFVAAVSTLRPGPSEGVAADRGVPAPTPVRDGEVVVTDPLLFQELRAIPADTPDPVTDAWVLASNAPTSGIFTRHPWSVPDASTDRASRARFHVHRIHGGWISIELLSNALVGADGAEKPIFKPVPVSWVVDALTAPPGWQLFLMRDPARSSPDPAPPPVPCKVGEILPYSQEVRTLVAVEGSPLPDGSLAGKAHVVWGRPLDVWERREVAVDSPAVETQGGLEIEVVPGQRLRVTRAERYRDARGRWFWDEGAHLPVDVPVRWIPWAAGGGGAAVLLVGVWAVRRRRHARALRA
jgi:hypothetical protein